MGEAKAPSIEKVADEVRNVAAATHKVDAEMRMSRV
jgi:hypothetical protein